MPDLMLNVQVAHEVNETVWLVVDEGEKWGIRHGYVEGYDIRYRGSDGQMMVGYYISGCEQPLKPHELYNCPSAAREVAANRNRTKES